MNVVMKSIVLPPCLFLHTRFEKWKKSVNDPMTVCLNAQMDAHNFYVIIKHEIIHNGQY